jgi:hypothetical protein
MKGYENASAKLPDAVLRLAMERDLPMYGDDDLPLGRYTSLVEDYPPPKDAGRKEAEAWLDMVEEKNREQRAKRRSFARMSSGFAFILDETELFLKGRFKKLAASDREKYVAAVKKIVDKL